MHKAVYGYTPNDGSAPELDERHDVAGNFLTFVALEIEGCNLVDLNDDFSHDYVMAAYDKAIDMAETTTLTTDEIRLARPPRTYFP